MNVNLQYFLLSCIGINFYYVSSDDDLEKAINPICTHVRDIFANASSDFIKCSIGYSRPIRFCENCVTKYINVQNSYKNLSHVVNNGTPCINSFVNLDRLGIVQTLYENSVNLWNHAKCYECFVMDNGKQTVNKSQETIEFTNLYDNFTYCLNQTDKDGVCVICMDKYLDLQSYFLSISNENEKIGVCMDLVDLMNTTWTFWGDTCCKFRRHKEYTFITSTVFVLVGTVLFYIIAQIYAKKKSPTIIEQTRFLNTLENDGND